MMPRRRQAFRAPTLATLLAGVAVMLAIASGTTGAQARRSLADAPAGVWAGVAFAVTLAFGALLILARSSAS